MMSPTPEQTRWPRRRWWWAIGLVFGAQLGFIFWLGESTPVRSRPPGPSPTLRLVGGMPAEWLALEDPTLFALPHWRGFSGPAWLKPPPITNRPPDWTEEPWTLPVAVTQLGALARQPLPTNALAPLRFLPVLEPGWAVAEPGPMALSPEQSALRIEGPLAACRPLTIPDLPSWQYDDVLTNTGVQVVVDAEGRPLSATLLFASGDPQADDYALAQARKSRFDVSAPAGPPGGPPSSPLGHLVRGLLVFQWHTVPVAPTNPPARR